MSSAPLCSTATQSMVIGRVEAKSKVATGFLIWCLRFENKYSVFQSPWLPFSGHTISSTGPSVSPFWDFLSSFTIYALLSRFTVCRDLRTFSTIFFRPKYPSSQHHTFFACMNKRPFAAMMLGRRKVVSLREIMSRSAYIPPYLKRSNKSRKLSHHQSFESLRICNDC